MRISGEWARQSGRRAANWATGGSRMDQQLYTQAVWFIQRLDKRYAINKGVGWVYALRNSFPGLCHPGSLV